MEGPASQAEAAPPSRCCSKEAPPRGGGGLGRGLNLVEKVSRRKRQAGLSSRQRHTGVVVFAQISQA